MKKLLFCLGFALLLGACSNDPESTSEEGTPAPTPIDFDSYFKVASATVGDSDTGLDLDGDGDIDNSIDDALNALNQAIYDAVAEALADSTIPEQCDGTTTVCQEELLATVESLLDELVSIDTINTVLGTLTSAGQGGILIEIQGTTGSDVALAWFVGARIINQPGTADTMGNGTFGPMDYDITLSYEFSTAPGSDPQTMEVSITLKEWTTEVNDIFSDSMRYISGAAITIDNILAEIEDVLVSVNESLPEEAQLDIDATVQELETTLEPYATVDLDGDGTGDAVALSVVGSATRVEDQ